MNDNMQFGMNFASVGDSPSEMMLRLISFMQEMTVQDVFIILLAFAGVVFLWGLFSIVYLAVWPDLPEFSPSKDDQNGTADNEAKESSDTY